MIKHAINIILYIFHDIKGYHYKEFIHHTNFLIFLAQEI